MTPGGFPRALGSYRETHREGDDYEVAVWWSGPRQARSNVGKRPPVRGTSGGILSYLSGSSEVCPISFHARDRTMMINKAGKSAAARCRNPPASTSSSWYTACGDRSGCGDVGGSSARG